MKKLIPVVKQMPKLIRDAGISISNPFRIRRAKSTKKIKWLTFFVTNYCNAKCEHCFYWNELNNREEEMSDEQITKTLTTIGSKLYSLRLSGGEPFLKKDRLINIFQVLNSKKLADKLSIPTHGMLEILPTIDRMLSHQKNVELNVSVSLDGLEKRHNETRKIKNGFNRAIINLRELVKIQNKNPQFEVSCSISLARQVVFPEQDGETSEVEQLIRFLRDDVGVKAIGYDHIRSAITDVHLLPEKINSNFQPPPTSEEDPNNKHKRAGSVQLDLDEMEEINQMLMRIEGDLIDDLTVKRLQKQVDIKRKKKRIVECMAGYVDGVLYPNGNVSICEFSKPFANLSTYNYDFNALWHGKEAESYRKLTSKCSCTHPCHLSDSLAYDDEFLKAYLAN